MRCAHIGAKSGAPAERGDGAYPQMVIPTGPMEIRARIRAHLVLPERRARLTTFARFSSVGTVAFLVDFAAFNLLSFGPGRLLGGQPLTAKAASVGMSTVVAWLGSRYWTFSDRRTQSRRRELATFAIVNAGGLVVSLSCLAFSHYLLELTSALADNIAANFVGLTLGTIFRFYFYRRVVFTGHPEALVREAAAAAVGRTARPTV